MDRINIKNLEVFASHGVFPEENKLGQKFVISAVLYTNIRKAGRSDDLSQSVHYGFVSQFMTDFMKNHTFQLIEACAEQMAEAVLLEYPLVKGIDLEIKKPWAPVGLPLETVSVQIHREWHRAYIALGANMGQESSYLDQAVEALQARFDCNVKKVADYIVTKPYGGVEQNDFLNSALEMDTLLDPWELLEVLHEIEAEAGRERLIHWGPRTLDLDILLYDDLILDTPDLVIPHKEMHFRDFVLKPMVQIAPYKRHPLLHRTIEELWSALDHEADQ